MYKFCSIGFPAAAVNLAANTTFNLIIHPLKLVFQVCTKMGLFGDNPYFWWWVDFLVLRGVFGLF
jgi:hypothetical protein